MRLDWGHSVKILWDCCTDIGGLSPYPIMKSTLELGVLETGCCCLKEKRPENAINMVWEVNYGWYHSEWSDLIRCLQAIIWKTEKMIRYSFQKMKPGCQYSPRLITNLDCKSIHGLENMTATSRIQQHTRCIWSDIFFGSHGFMMAIMSGRLYYRLQQHAFLFKAFAICISCHCWECAVCVAQIRLNSRELWAYRAIQHSYGFYVTFLMFVLCLLFCGSYLML